MSEELKTAVVFVCAAMPNPIIEFSDMSTVKTKQGFWLPAILAKSMLPDGNEYITKFPVFCMDALDEAALESLRTTLHTRVDSTIDEHKRVSRENAERDAKKEFKAVNPKLAVATDEDEVAE